MLGGDEGTGDTVTANRILISRRKFVTQLGVGAAAGALASLPAVAETPNARRRVVVMSDLHIGRPAEGMDGAGWLARGFADIKENLRRVDYGLTLGDLTHNGDGASLETYLRIRDEHPTPRWFELAGNHEYHSDGIGRFKKLVRDTEPYCHIDGNVAWYFLSAESGACAGHVSAERRRWLRRNLTANADRINIVCSHHPPPDTTRRSDESIFYLHPRRKIREILSSFPIALWLSGHEHHRPYSSGNLVFKNGTACINVASISHAYGTEASGSLVLDIDDGQREIVARRRDHDNREFRKEFSLRIPLARTVRLGPRSVHGN